MKGVARARAYALEARRRALEATSPVRGAGPDLRATNERFFERVGVDRAPAEKRTNEVLQRLGHDGPPEGSLHFLAFAALAEAGFRPRVVLELGTFRAEATEYLAELFPDAEVHTVDLPDDDPIVRQFGLDSAGVHKRGKRLDRPNITAHRANTLFLADLSMPTADLIWLDAGHHFPEVAWDHAFCLHHLNPGGWLFSDDIRLPANPLYRHRGSAFDAWRVVDYWNQRSTDRFELLAKREDVTLAKVDPKYIAYLQRG